MFTRIAVAAALFAAAFALVGPGSARPAHAAGALSVSPSSGLDPDGAFVVVSGSGFTPNAQLFVMQCRATSTSDHTCNSVGLRKVTTDAAGNFTANAMQVVARFGATDCLAVACAIKTSAVAEHVDDRSQDRSAAISFRAQPAATVPPQAPAPTQPAPVANQPATPGEATVDPAPEPETTTTTTEATTTTTEATTTTTEATTTTTEADDADESSSADDDRRRAAEAAAAAEGSASDGGGGGGVSGVVLAAVAVLVLVGVAGAVFAVRRRSAAATPSPA